MVIDILKEKFELQYEDDKIKVIPQNNLSFTTYPIEGDYILISEDEYIGLLLHLYMFDDELKHVVPYKLSIIETKGE